MNWKHKVIRLLSRALRVSNRYEATQFSTERGWLPGTLQSARLDITACTRSELQRKSRYFEKNNPIYNRIADLFELYVAGRGLQLKAASSSNEWNAAADESFARWSRFCDYSGRRSFMVLHSLWARSWFVDGGCFILLTRGEGGRPRLQTIEAHRVSTPDEMIATGVIYLDILITPLHAEAGNSDGGYMVQVQDISERKKTEEALRESQHDLSHAQEVAHTGNWRLHVRRNELFWSDETYRNVRHPQGNAYDL